MKGKKADKFAKEKALLIHTNDLFRSKSPLKDLEEHTSINRKRKAVRIFLVHPVEVKISEEGGKKTAIHGRSINVSGAGILIDTEIDLSFWERLESNIIENPLTYMFINHDELAGDIIEGMVTRYVKKSGTKNKKLEIELGIQHKSTGIDNKINLLQFINNKIIESINKDIEHIEELIKKRKLTKQEQKIFNILLTEYSDRK
ncbi:hypothetical protein IID62_09020 [candidate division KSB1 bacterium]|nr:hypothetical protein [candidate division KSB1 bacterium]